MKGSIGTSMTYYIVKDFNSNPKNVKKTKKQRQRAHRIKENKSKCRKCFYFNSAKKMCNYNRKEIPEKGKGSECKHQITRKNVSEQQAYQLNRQLSLKFNEIIETPKVKKAIKKTVVGQNDRVKLINLTKKLMLDIQLVPQNKHNDFEYKISVHSPLGKAIHKKQVGETVKIKNQGKDEIYKIVSIMT